MFRRHWSGLPPDASFPEKLSDLGYFVNEEDEVRLIADPEYYFKFFLDRNTRVNLRQRFDFDNAVEALIHSRLEQRGLERMALPLGATPPSERHVPIYVSPQLAARSRVVVFLGEPSQELGVLSKRVACGPGGINKGSLVSVVEALGRQASHTADASPPGLVIANPGQLWWWPEGRRALTTIASSAIPLPSLVHYGRRHVPALNTIPGNEDPTGHVRYLWSDVLPVLVSAEACLSIIAVGESCELVTKLFDDTNNWATWGHRLSSMLLIGTVYSDESLTNTALKDFMAKRARAYLLSSSPLNTPLAPPNSDESECIPSFGCPGYSSAEPYYTELILINALEPALEYIETVATTPGFENPAIVVTAKPEPNEEGFTEDDWTKLPDDCKPSITVAPDV